jgi:imidazolonepropionase-like amidohydrolase
VIRWCLRAVLAAAILLTTLGCGNADRDAGVGGTRAASVATKTLYVQADQLFNGRTLISGRVAVAVRGGKIVAAGRLKIPRGARVIRLRNATILPGMIDLHVHESPWALLRMGVTTTRNVGITERGLRRPITPPGYPRIVYAGPVITVPGGYPSRRFPALAAPVRSPQEAAAKVRSLVAKGAAVIKIALETGMDGSLPTLSVEQVQAIVAEAHRHRRIVTAHALEGKGVAIALAGGVDELAHMPCVGVTPEQIATLVERRIPVVGTLHVAQLFISRGGIICPDLMANARAFVRQGGTLFYGTDIPLVPPTLDRTELGLMQQAGMTATQVLRAATAEAGKELGMAPLGTLQRGAPADLFAVRGDPTRSLATLRRPVFVMARGARIR